MRMRTSYRTSKSKCEYYHMHPPKEAELTLSYSKSVDIQRPRHNLIGAFWKLLIDKKLLE